MSAFVEPHGTRASDTVSMRDMPCPKRIRWTVWVGMFAKEIVIWTAQTTRVTGRVVDSQQEIKQEGIKSPRRGQRWSWTLSRSQSQLGSGIISGRATSR